MHIQIVVTPVEIHGLWSPAENESCAL